LKGSGELDLDLVTGSGLSVRLRSQCKRQPSGIKGQSNRHIVAIPQVLRSALVRLSCIRIQKLRRYEIAPRVIHLGIV